MKVDLYAIQDVVAEKFNTPFASENELTAKRTVARACLVDEGFINNPEDYRLFKIGEYDPETGQVVPESTPKLVCEVYSLVKQPD